MSKYFIFKEDIPKLEHPEDIKKIRDYLEYVGELKCTDRQLCILWYRFSDSWDASWLIPNNDVLKHFSIWLADYNEDD